jgi:hypothetical protein
MMVIIKSPTETPKGPFDGLYIPLVPGRPAHRRDRSSLSPIGDLKKLENKYKERAADGQSLTILGGQQVMRTRIPNCNEFERIDRPSGTISGHR